MTWEDTQKFAAKFGFTLIDPDDDVEEDEVDDTEVWVVAVGEGRDDGLPASEVK